jgi:hypothetical protein
MPPLKHSLENLTSPATSVDTASNAKLKGIRNCGHGHVYVHGVRTRPFGSREADALDANDLETRRPGPQEDAGRFTLMDSPFPTLR